MTKTTVVIWLKKSFDLHNKIKKMPKHRGELSLSSKYPPTDMLFEGIYHDKMIKFALPIQIDSVHSSDVPKTWASCFVDHGNHSRTVFENEQLGWLRTAWNVGWNLATWFKHATVRVWMRLNDSIACVTRKKSLGYLIGQCFQYTLPLLKNW